MHKNEAEMEEAQLARLKALPQPFAFIYKLVSCLPWLLSRKTKGRLIRNQQEKLFARGVRGLVRIWAFKLGWRVRRNHCKINFPFLTSNVPCTIEYILRSLQLLYIRTICMLKVFFLVKGRNLTKGKWGTEREREGERNVDSERAREEVSGGGRREREREEEQNLCHGDLFLEQITQNRRTFFGAGHSKYVIPNKYAILRGPHTSHLSGKREHYPKLLITRPCEPSRLS